MYEREYDRKTIGITSLTDENLSVVVTVTSTGLSREYVKTSPVVTKYSPSL